MPVLVVQQGHCYRSTGATGTTGEQQYATRVGNACTRLLHGKGGWTVRLILADAPSAQYRGDAFFAIHCDGSTSSTARGASIGYRNAAGQQVGQAWKRAYEARGWSGFRPDNYTTALSGYYGTGTAVAQGNTRAVILECGFRTNPQDLAALDGPGGVDRVALAIGDALGIPHSATPPEDPTVKNLILANKLGPDGKTPTGEIWVGDGITRRHVADPNELSGLRHWIQQKGGDPTVHSFGDLRVLGKVPPETLPVELDYDRFLTDVVANLAAVLEATGISLPLSQVTEIAQATASATVAEFKKEGN